MKQYIDKIKTIGRELSNEFGPLNLFAFTEREDLKDKWDVLISISPTPKDKKEFINNVIRKFQIHLSSNELVKITRFLFLESDHPVVQYFNTFVHIEFGDVEIKNSSINNVRIDHAIVISSVRNRDKE